MKVSVSLLQLIGMLLVYATLGYLLPLSMTSSLNPFQGAPFWAVISVLLILFLSLFLTLVEGRWTPTFKPTRLQWVGVGLLSFVLYAAVDLLTTHATQRDGMFLGAFGVIVLFGLQLIRSNRSLKRD